MNIINSHGLNRQQLIIVFTLAKYFGIKVHQDENYRRELVKCNPAELAQQYLSYPFLTLDIRGISGNALSNDSQKNVSFEGFLSAMLPDPKKFEFYSNNLYACGNVGNGTVTIKNVTYPIDALRSLLAEYDSVVQKNA
jgi:hypothetical protein